MHTKSALLTLMAVFVGLLSSKSGVNADTCGDSLYPVYAGGSTGNENVGCFVYDPIEQLIIVGGNTTSEDFAPSKSSHGFMFALDLDGNWKWGNFFYNVSYAVTQISGCQMASDGKSISVLGLGNTQPVLMSMNTKDGTFQSFISLEYWNTTTSSDIKFKTQGAIYNDVVDYYDDQNYYYTSFIMDDKLELLRMRNGATPTIDWTYEFIDFTAAEATDIFRQKDPAFITSDPRDEQVLYLIGRYQGRGSVIRFQKRDARVRWYARFEYLTKVQAYSQATNDDSLYLCGDYQPNWSTDSDPFQISEYKGGIVRMKNDGTIKWFIQFDGTNPKLDVANGINNQDRCMGITYDSQSSQLSVLLQTKASQLRDKNKGNFYDTALMVLDQTGNVKRTVVITQATLAYDMYSTSQGLIQVGEGFYFAGHSYGYKTAFNEQRASTTTPFYDSYVYKYQFDREGVYTCLFEAEIDNSVAGRRLKMWSESSIEQQGVASVSTRQSDVKVVQQNKYFVPYTSRYSGGFPLLDTMRIPRPCAYKSMNMTTVRYYRGQNDLTYDIYRENEGNTFSLMQNNPQILFQDGKPADTLARLDKAKSTILIQTNDDGFVGNQKVLVRDCDRMDRLLEMNLYISVISNTYPDFVKEPQTTFTMAVGDVINYPLPDVVDPEGNDIPEVYIGVMDAQEEKYPPFLLYENSTRTITLKPASKWVAGRTYYFTIVVKESNSDSVSYSFYCTVRITGEIIEQDFSIKYTDVNYTVNWLDDYSHGSLKFTSPINMTWLQGNFFQMFNIYWRDTEYRTNKKNHTFLEFETTHFQDDNMTVNFTMTFVEPYSIGLLRKKSDRIHIDVNDGFNYTDLFVGNKSEHRLTTFETKTRLEMIFDFRNHYMKTLRQIAARMYWVLIAIILIQFAALTLRGVGLLPVWIFIEYLQLVGFMPIYNFKLIPYLYDAFKPSLVSHMIIFDDTPFVVDMDNEYFNKNYQYYWLSVGRLSQSFVACVILLIFVLLANLVVYVINKANVSNPSLNAWAKKKMVQFKYNAYIRYYMLVYFDLTFFSVMKIMQPNNSTIFRRAALLLSYILFVLSILIPVFLITHINRRFDILGLKEAKESFNTLLLKIDKASRWRVMNPLYFFARRLLTAMLLTLPIENTFIFLQYVFILMSSHAYILYMVACKPYQTPQINTYVLSNETFYSALIIAIFIFSDATPELNIKVGAGVALMASLILLVLSNLIMIIIYMVQGPDYIKKQIKEATLKRAEKEALERAEEEERKLKKKKEEEEFSKIPDDTVNSSAVDVANTTGQNNTMSELTGKGSKKRNKKKGVEDNVVEPGMAGVNSDDFGGSKKRKKKAKQDDLADGSVPEKKRRRKANADATTTGAGGTDYGNTNPTQKDYLDQ